MPFEIKGVLRDLQLLNSFVLTRRDIRTVVIIRVLQAQCAVPVDETVANKARLQKTPKNKQYCWWWELCLKYLPRNMGNMGNTKLSSSTTATRVLQPSCPTTATLHWNIRYLLATYIGHDVVKTDAAEHERWRCITAGLEHNWQD